MDAFLLLEKQVTEVARNALYQLRWVYWLLPPLKKSGHSDRF